MPILPTDHEVDLAEADKHLKQSDVEVEEAVEDILNEESDDENAVPLVDYTIAKWTECSLHHDTISKDVKESRQQVLGLKLPKQLHNYTLNQVESPPP